MANRCPHCDVILSEMERKGANCPVCGRSLSSSSSTEPLRGEAHSPAAAFGAVAATTPETIVTATPVIQASRAPSARPHECRICHQIVPPLEQRILRMNRTSFGVTGSVKMNYTDFAVPMCDACYRRGRSLQTIRYLSVTAMLLLPMISLVLGVALAEGVSKPLGIIVLVGGMIFPFSVLPFLTGRIIGDRARAMFDKELGGRLRMLVGGRQFGLLCSPFFRYAPVKNTEPIPIDTLMALPLDPKIDDPRRTRAGRLLFAAISVVLVLAFAAFVLRVTYFSPMNMLIRETEQKLTTLREAIDDASNKLPAAGDVVETKPDTTPKPVIVRENLMVLSLETVQDPAHAWDDRLPLPDLHRRFDKSQTIYDWELPKDEKKSDINRDLQAAEEVWGDWNDTRYVVLVRFLDWTGPEETSPDRFAPTGGLAPGRAVFEAFLIDAHDGRLLAAKKLEVDQDGQFIRYKLYENKVEVARKQLTEQTIAAIDAWLESACGAKVSNVGEGN